MMRKEGARLQSLPSSPAANAAAGAVDPPGLRLGRLRGLAARHASVVSFVILAVLAVLRAPYILFRGRFWAEEGAIYFPTLRARGWTGLLFVYERAGYLFFFANFGAWLATLVPLEVAPLITAWLSLAVVLLLLWVILTWPSRLLPNRGAKIIAAALLLLGAAAQPEVWLNTINAQTYLGITAFVILFTNLDELGRGSFAVSVGTLAVAGLSGLYAAALTPLFILDAWREQTRRYWVRAGVISIAALAQIAAVAVSVQSHAVAATKLVWPPVREALRTVASSHLDSVILGRIESGKLARLAQSGDVIGEFAIGSIAILGAAIIGILLWRSRARWVSAMLLGAFALTELLVQFGSQGEASGRYSVVPVAIVTLAAVHGVAVLDGQRLQWVGVAVAAVILTIGVIEFWTDAATLLRCYGCPDWSTEVSRWRLDPSRALSIWPYPRFTTHLP